ncbi:MAG: hypothetical protein ACOCUV_03930 [bacterium]
MFKINPKYKKYIRPVAGIIFLVLGSVFMLIPFIPLGYIMIFIGLFLMAAQLPFLRKWIRKLKRKDEKGRVENVEKGIEDTENNMTKDEKK